MASVVRQAAEDLQPPDRFKYMLAIVLINQSHLAPLDPSHPFNDTSPARGEGVPNL
jgi:hypothetical protein